MIYMIPEVRVMKQQKVRKKKKSLFKFSFSVQSVKNHGTKMKYTSHCFMCEYEEIV